MFAVLPPLRKVLTRLIALLSILWIAACEPMGPGGGGGQGQPIEPGAPVPVALLVPHGSAASGEAALARDLEAAARMAVADLGGVPIDLRVYGTAGQPAQAQKAALNAVSDGAKIIVGPLHAESANAVAVAVAPKNVNVLAFSNNPTIAGGNLFVLGQTFENTANRLMRHAARQGTKRIVTVHSRNLSGQLGQQAIAKAAANAGAQVVANVGYDFSKQGVVDAVPQVESAVRSNAADGVFLTANSAGALPLFAQMLPENGLDPASTQYIGLARWDTPSQTLDLPAVQGGWFALPDRGKSARFAARFQREKGSRPNPIAGLAYDGIAAVGALVKSGRRDALSKAQLTQSSGFKGVYGAFRLRRDGTNQRSLAVATVRDGQVVILDPAPQGFGGAGS